MENHKIKSVGLVVNSSWNVYNFRLGLLDAINQCGYSIIIFAPHDEYVSRIPYPVVPVKMHPRSTNPWKDLILFFRLLRVYRKHKPHVLLHYTAKPNIYGTLAARFCGIPCINNIAGLGSLFSKKSQLKLLIKTLYKYSQKYAAKVFFQNREDREEFVEGGIVDSRKVALLPGSGINTAEFYPRTPMVTTGVVRFLLVSRLLHEKGIREYIEAAVDLKSRIPDRVEFSLAGKFVKDSPGEIEQHDIDRWNRGKAVNFLGPSDNVKDLMEKSDCIVLPSYYREGVPRVLLEAASLGKPLVTTHNIGCREVVEDSVNGYLCEPRNATDLAEKMMRFVELPFEEKVLMASKSRDKAVLEFDERLVIDQYLSAMETLLETS